MKTLKCLIYLFVVLGLAIILSCSDKSQSPTSPQDLSSLGKVIITEFTAIDYPIELLDPGTTKIAGGNLIIKDMIFKCRFDSNEPLVNGILIITINAVWDINTGEGPVHGKWTLTPDANVNNGVWEGNWQGYRTKTGESEWTSNIQDVGKGNGGDIDGMHLSSTEVLHSWDIFSSLGFLGQCSGIIKSH